MAPKSMQRPEQIVIAVQHGAELGLAPMQSCQSICVINGRPSIWGDGLLALVIANPLCMYIDEDWDGEGDDYHAWCETHRRGWRKPMRRTFSVRQAKKAGLWSKEGPWQQYPDRMLQMRARAFCLRDQYPDLLRGIAVAEEVLDYTEDAPKPVEAQAATVRPEQMTPAQYLRQQEEGPFSPTPEPEPEPRTEVSPKSVPEDENAPKERTRVGPDSEKRRGKRKQVAPKSEEAPAKPLKSDLFGEPLEGQSSDILRCTHCDSTATWSHAATGTTCPKCGMAGTPVA